MVFVLKQKIWKSMETPSDEKWQGHKNRKRKRNVSNYISLLCPSVFLFRFTNLSFSLVETGKGPPTSTPSSSLLEVLVWLRLCSLAVQCYSMLRWWCRWWKVGESISNFRANHQPSCTTKTTHMRVKDPSNKANRHFSFAVVMTCCSHRLQRPSSGKK